MRKTLRQRFHLEPPAGLLNDPNGLAWYRGVYHVYFQWNKFEKNHSYKEWGSFASDDLVHWQFQGSALVPDQPYDQNGVYSGSALEIDGKLCLYYTGNVKHQGLRNSRQCLAVTEDGRRHLKLGPVLEKPDGYTPHFRDPKVFRGKTDGTTCSSAPSRPSNPAPARRPAPPQLPQTMTRPTSSPPPS